MKICIVTHKVIKGDGQGRANYEIVLAAIRCGHHVTLVASNVSSELQQHPQVNWISISVKVLPTALLSNLMFSWKSRNWLHKHCHEFDLLMVNGCVTDFLSGINTVHFVHSGWLRSPFHTSRLRRDLYGFYQWLYSTLNSYWEKKSFRKSKVVVAVSQRIKQELMEIGVPAEKIRVILNGVDGDEFFPSPSDRRQYGLDKEAVFALFVGDIRTPRKNLDTVLQALVKVPDLHLVVVGDTDRSPYLDAAKKLGLMERVHFFGYRCDVAEIMQAMDLFVFPSRYEACTLVLLEAMATGLPVITAITTGGSEMVTPESGILLSGSEDVVGLVDALTKLTSDRELRLQMGKVARAIAEQHNWKSKAQKYVDLFEEFTK